MNHQDQDFEKLERNMYDIDKIVQKVRNGKIGVQDAIKSMTQADRVFVRITNDILKREWQRTKQHLREDTIEVSALRSDDRTLLYFRNEVIRDRVFGQR